MKPGDNLRLRLAVSETIELHKWRVFRAVCLVQRLRQELEEAEKDLVMFRRLQVDALEAIKPDERKRASR